MMRKTEISTRVNGVVYYLIGKSAKANGYCCFILRSASLITTLLVRVYNCFVLLSKGHWIPFHCLFIMGRPYR
jgi:hypothetical protein